MYILNEASMKEAFKSGTSGKVIGQFVRILGRRLGKRFMVSPYGYDNKTPEGMFKSFYVMFPDGIKALRINFSIKNSDIIHSVDFFKTPSRVPDVKIYLDGLNIVQVLKTVEDAIRGHIDDYSESVDKKISVTEVARSEDAELLQWFNSAQVQSVVQSSTAAKLAKAYAEYCTSNGKVMAKNAYGKIIRAIKDQAARDPSFVPSQVSVGRTDGAVTPDRPIVNQQAAMEFSSIQNEQDDHLKKYEMLQQYLKILCSDHQPKPINGLWVAGKAGVGKTDSVAPILQSLGASYRVYGGTIGGVSALYNVLWTHSSSDLVDIIIFDDCDKVLKDGLDMLKMAMDTKEVRTVTYAKAFRAGESVIREEDDDDAVPIAAFGDPSALAIEIPRTAPPERFAVHPRIIFISNLPEVPKPILSRCLSVVFNFSEQQIWDLMFDNIENIIDPSRRANQWSSVTGIEFRQLTKEGAREVMEYCRELKAGVDSADFRQVNFAITIWAACNDDSWKRWVRMHFRRI